jgi:hypothetical protein
LIGIAYPDKSQARILEVDDSNYLSEQAVTNSAGLLRGLSPIFAGHI